MENYRKDGKYNVLFVCLGNICRSPAAEGIFARIINENKQEDKIGIDSAGTSGYHDGNLPDHRMRAHGAKRGYSFQTLSRKFVSNDFYDFDIIIAMDDRNYDHIMDLSPDLQSQQKVHRMVDFMTLQQRHDHIPDPYYSGAEGFDLVLDLLEDACNGLYRYIKEKNPTIG